MFDWVEVRRVRRQLQQLYFVLHEEELSLQARVDRCVVHGQTMICPAQLSEFDVFKHGYEGVAVESFAGLRDVQAAEVVADAAPHVDLHRVLILGCRVWSLTGALIMVFIYCITNVIYQKEPRIKRKIS